MRARASFCLLLLLAAPGRARAGAAAGGDEPTPGDTGAQVSSAQGDVLDDWQIALFFVGELGALGAIEANIETIVRDERRWQVATAGLALGLGNVYLATRLRARAGENKPAALPGDADSTWGNALLGAGLISVGLSTWNLFLEPRKRRALALVPGPGGVSLLGAF